MKHAGLFVGGAALLVLVGSTFAQQVDKPILTGRSYWRWMKVCRPPVIDPSYPSEDKRAAGQRRVITGKPIDAAAAGGGRLPNGWTEAGFGDGDWPRTRLAWMGDVAFSGHNTGVVVLRGKFRVTDPAEVKALALSAAFRGGLAVYLNGRPVGRSGLPDGALAPSTPATPYPAALFLDGKGRPYKFPNAYHARQRIAKGDKDLASRLARRDRRVEGLALPLEALHRGVNVLAVAVHRSDYHPTATRWGKTLKDSAWLPCHLMSLTLSAKGTGIEPNVARPAGRQVWNVDRNDRTCLADYGDPCEALRPLRLLAPRNATVSGKVVFGSREKVSGLKATVGPLTGGGGQSLPASAVTIRYALPDAAGNGLRFFDALTDQAPAELAPLKAAEGICQPIWVSVTVPADAARGEYRGTLTVSADGVEPTRAPVRLTVFGWTCPALVRSRTYCGIYQSPTTLAMRYGVKEWSEAHWRLMERSFRLLGDLGSDIVNIPVSERTQFGNEEGMVYWVRQTDGSFKHDFAVFDRYMGLVKKHLIDPDFIVLNLYHAGGWADRGPKQPNTVTVVDAATGRRESMQVPEFGTDASKAFWQPVLKALHQRLKTLGCADKFTLGALSDGLPGKKTFAVFHQIIPDVGWARYCHTTVRGDRPAPLRGGGRIVVQEYVYLPDLPAPGRPIPPIHTYARGPRAAFMRHEFDHRINLLAYRTMGERALLRQTRGFGRICLDFWPVLKVGRRMRDLNNRWPASSTAQRSPTLLHLSWPGKDGAEPTVRLEALRESIQDAEAMILLAEAADKHADALGAGLAARCRDLLRDRADYDRARYVQRWQKVHFHVNHHGWQGLAERLYRLATETAAKRPAARDHGGKPKG